MKTVTVSEVMRWEPCATYTLACVNNLFDGRKKLTAQDIAKLEIQSVDRLWALVEMMPDDRVRRLFADDCNKRVVEQGAEKFHPAPWPYFDVSDDVREIARCSVMAVVRSKATGPSQSKWYAARHVERAWQLAHAVKMIEES